MTKQKGGHVKIISYRTRGGKLCYRSDPSTKESHNPYIDGRQLRGIVGLEDQETINGKPEDAYKVQFETTDLTRVCER